MSLAVPSRGPGAAALDIDMLRALRRPTRDEDLILRRIERHFSEQDGYLALSGGKDSLVVLHLARQVDPNVPVCFFDGGLKFPETYTFLADLADAWNLNLNVICTRLSALQVLIEDGSWDHRAPTPAPHSVPCLGEVVIDEPAAEAHRRFGDGELWGVRAEESRGRAAAYSNALRAEIARACNQTCHSRRDVHGGMIRRVDGTVAYGPVWNWKTSEIWGYLARHNVPVNPVYAKLRAMGAPEHFQRLSCMIDAGRLEEGRAVWLRRGWPELFEHLREALPRINEFI